MSHEESASIHALVEESKRMEELARLLYERVTADKEEDLRKTDPGRSKLVSGPPPDLDLTVTAA